MSNPDAAPLRFNHQPSTINHQPSTNYQTIKLFKRCHHFKAFGSGAW